MSYCPARMYRDLYTKDLTIEDHRLSPVYLSSNTGNLFNVKRTVIQKILIF